MTSSTFDESVAMRILSELRNRVPSDQWSTWFEEVEITGDADHITLQVPSSLLSAFLQHQ